ncbi:ABC transporter permease (plasmid) [Streptomyces sp. BI20]|uniref:ABC transporter permease n=1 Tax=Streptomyces sp. BI20 TaxID=3403460 RepID=UPI003C76F48D
MSTTTPAATPATPTPILDSTAAGAPGPEGGFRDLLAAEWIKLRSLRSTAWTVGLTLLFALGATAVTALTGDRPAGAAFLPYVAYPPAGWWTLILVASVSGALAAVGEYSTGLVRTTTVAVPARGAVVLAKAGVVGALWTAVGALLSCGAVLTAHLLTGGRLADLPLDAPGVFRAMIASALLAPVCALVGLGLGVLVRHAGGTIAIAVGVLVMLPPLFSEREAWSAQLKHSMVLPAWNRLVQTWEPDPSSLNLPAGVPGSWLVLLLWPALALALAVLTVRRRDV